MSQLRNIYSKEECLKRLAQEDFERKTVSFYRYVKITDPQKMRDTLYVEWDSLGVLGRIYVAAEGINAQLSVPEHNWNKFVDQLYAHPEFNNIPFKVGLQEGESFWKLTIKVKKQIVADGLAEDEYDVTNVGKHLTAEEFNEAIEEGAVVVDMRNAYESRIGHFEGAITPDVDTFRDELPLVKEMLEDKKDKKVLLYCTGGIRCEKASAYLKHHGFKDVNQLHGGIIQYKHEAEKKGLPIRFVGKNYVFDGRTAEKVTDDVLTECDQCDAKCDDFTNCANVMCNLLFIQCSECKTTFENCCNVDCQKIIHLPEEEQKKLRKKQAPSGTAKYRKRVRPKIKGGIAQEGPIYEFKKQ